MTDIQKVVDDHIRVIAREEIAKIVMIDRETLVALIDARIAIAFGAQPDAPQYVMPSTKEIVKACGDTNADVFSEVARAAVDALTKQIDEELLDKLAEEPTLDEVDLRAQIEAALESGGFLSGAIPGLGAPNIEKAHKIIDDMVSMGIVALDGDTYRLKPLPAPSTWPVVPDAPRPATPTQEGAQAAKTRNRRTQAQIVEDYADAVLALLAKGPHNEMAVMALQSTKSAQPLIDAIGALIKHGKIVREGDTFALAPASTPTQQDPATPPVEAADPPRPSTPNADGRIPWSAKYSVQPPEQVGRGIFDARIRDIQSNVFIMDTVPLDWKNASYRCGVGEGQEDFGLIHEYIVNKAVEAGKPIADINRATYACATPEPTVPVEEPVAVVEAEVLDDPYAVPQEPQDAQQPIDESASAFNSAVLKATECVEEIGKEIAASSLTSPTLGMMGRLDAKLLEIAQNFDVDPEELRRVVVPEAWDEQDGPGYMPEKREYPVWMGKSVILSPGAQEHLNHGFIRDLLTMHGRGEHGVIDKDTRAVNARAKEQKDLAIISSRYAYSKLGPDVFVIVTTVKGQTMTAIMLSTEKKRSDDDLEEYKKHLAKKPLTDYA